MSCPGSSHENCGSCEHSGYCDRVWVCNGDCGHCEDVDCENNYLNREPSFIGGESLDVDDFCFFDDEDEGYY